LYKLKVMTLGG